MPYDTGMMSIIEQLEQDLRDKHLLQHPLYQSWSAGTLPLPALQSYAVQYYHFVALFSRLVSRVHSQTPHLEDRLEILDNLLEEEDRELPHEELWLRFAEGIGVDKNRILEDEVLPETRYALATFKRLCAGSNVRGAAALLAYEAQVSDIAQLKRAGLRKFYNVSTPKTLEFFKVHAVVDIEHQKTWKNLIARRATTGRLKESARLSLRSSLDAMWGLLDGVYRKHC